MTIHQSKYYAHYITLQNPSTSLERLGNSLLNATIDLNPHQVQWALFYFRNPLSNGVLLADEVWLGKTIEWWLVLCQLWNELKRNIILVVPAALRKQRKSELEEKFFLPSEILDGTTYREYKKQWIKDPFNQNKIIITSYQFAAKHEAEIVKIAWNVVVIDEAHNLRNVYNNPTGTASVLQRMFAHTKKILLTATPLQNSLMELYWLVSYIDPYTFGDRDSFRKQFSQPNHLKLKDLKERMRPLMNRSLRSQVQEYIRYTKRIPFVEHFEPSDQEMELYDKISEFLKKEDLQIITTKTRHLIILILRKLLASSSHAIAGTLDTMIARIEKHETLEDVLDDTDIMEEYEEFIDDKEEQEELKENLIRLREELEEIKWFRELAKNITVDAKTIALRKVLDTALGQIVQKWWNKKALVFTWFRRTQDYLKLYLEAHGYEWKIVLFNGSNSDAHSQWIYHNWLEKHKWSDKVSWSKSSDMRAALVEYFRDDAEIMIATESAAEWVNMQFCSIIINYDLPWNPQRIEQRIGRCHRYWQQHDVVVVNFINSKNYADQRVYELLSSKFALFEWVFEASDEVLWSIWDGTTIEQSILNIYQKCRTKEEIDLAFKELEDSMRPEIDTRMKQTKAEILEHFDSEVIRRLKNIDQEGKAKLWLYKELFWNVTRSVLDSKAVFDEDEFVFTLQDAPWSGILLWNYSIEKDKRDTMYFHRPNSELGEWIIDQVKNAETDTISMTFYPDRYHSNISVLQEYKWTSWYLRVDKLTITSFDNEEYLIHTCMTNDGKLLPREFGHKLLLVPSESQWTIQIEPTIEQQLISWYEQWIAESFDEAMSRNSTVLNDQINKLDAREEDKKLSLLKELDEIKTEIASKRRESIREINPQAKLEMRKTITKLEQSQKMKQEQYFIHVDEIQQEKRKLIDELEERMKAWRKSEYLFTIKRTIA